MATVKIILEQGEMPEEVEETLIKALIEKNDQAFKEQRFDDPIMNELAEEADSIYVQNYSQMIKEIIDVLKEGS